ncbi:MAG: hypothetical protein GY929_14610 [Actinomycetia bacterium]|nr:hypothetical protein [Actinomycetes bacterium]
MTTAFVDAAELMARVCGVPDHEFAVVEHPIASADDGGLRARAELATHRAVELWTGKTSGSYRQIGV